MSEPTLRINIKMFSHCLNMPQYDTPGSTRLDLYAAISNLMLLQPDEKQSIPTGIAIALPKGYEGQISTYEGAHNVKAYGTVDSDYIDEINVILVNEGKNTFEILPGAVIAHIVIMKYIKVRWALCKIEQNSAIVTQLPESENNTRAENSASSGSLCTSFLDSLNISNEPYGDRTADTLHILRMYLDNFDTSENGRINEAKNILQELLVKNKLPLPKYKYNFIGPSNDRTFQGTVTIQFSPTNTMIVTGDYEYTKKDAEKSAAFNVLKKLKGE